MAKKCSGCAFMIDRGERKLHICLTHGMYCYKILSCRVYIEGNGILKRLEELEEKVKRMNNE